MDVDGSLGPSGGSGRIEPIRHVVGRGGCFRPLGASARQYVLNLSRAFDCLPAYGDQLGASAVYLHGSLVLRQEVVIDDQRLRPSVRNNESEVLGGQTGADRHCDRADAHDAEEGRDEDRTVLQQQQRAVAFSETGSQRIGESVHLGIELVERDRLIAE